MDPTVSRNGRYVVFSTDAGNLTRGDDDRLSDVFVRDLKKGSIRIVSRGIRGRDLNGDAVGGDITPDGRYVLFDTGAMNAHPDANGVGQIYRRDLRTGRMTMISRGVSGAPGNIESDGGAITPDGRYVVFSTYATNLLGGGGDPNAATIKVFVRDTKRNRTIPASVSPSGAIVSGVGNSISANGRFVAFVYGTRNGPAEVYVRDLVSRRTSRISKTYDGSTNREIHSARSALITPNGRYVMFTHRSPKIVRSDTNRDADVFVYDRRTKRTVRASIATNGAQSDGDSLGLSISDDGAVVTFTSAARNLDPRVTFKNNGFARDLRTGRTRLFTICDDGTPTDGHHNPDQIVISGNKRTIVAATQATNWAPEPNNGRYQIYHRPFDILPPTVLTTAGPYAAQPGEVVALRGSASRPNGNPRQGVTIRFIVSKPDGTTLWRSSSTTDSAGAATVSYAADLAHGRYFVTSIVPRTAGFARASASDALSIGV